LRLSEAPAGIYLQKTAKVPGGQDELEAKLRPSRSLIKISGAVTVTALVAFLVSSPGVSFAQGFNLSQLLGGGSKQQHGTSGGSNNQSGVSVQRSAQPFTGKFVGKQEDQGAEISMTAQFACYPASDSALPQAKTFVCYAAGSKDKSQSSAATE